MKRKLNNTYSKRILKEREKWKDNDKSMEFPVILTSKTSHGLVLISHWRGTHVPSISAHHIYLLDKHQYILSAIFR